MITISEIAILTETRLSVRLVGDTMRHGKRIYVVDFNPDLDITDGHFLTSTSGRGTTQMKAMRELADNIQGKRLRRSQSGPVVREYVIPTKVSAR